MSIRRVCGIAAIVLVLAAANPVRATTSRRLAGADRYQTAAAIARATFPQRPTGAAADHAVIVRGDDFADALAASGLGAGPILLTERDHLNDATAAVIDELGVTRVDILGGEDVIGAAVQRELETMGVNVWRYAGNDRYETAALAVGSKYNFEAAAPGEVRGQRTVVVVSGERFADALAIGPLAYSRNLPVLLTRRDALPSATRSELQAQPAEQVIVVGGTASVSDDVVTQIETMGYPVWRIAGADRQDTAAQIASLFFTDAVGNVPMHVNLARGDTYPDALAGAPHAGAEWGPILLTVDIDTLGEVTRDWLAIHADDVDDLHVFGDATAVSDAVVAEAASAADG